jgi:hypothetical protein
MERLIGCLRAPIGTPGVPYEGGSPLGAQIAGVASSVGTPADPQAKRAMGLRGDGAAGRRSGPAAPVRTDTPQDRTMTAP